MKRKNIIIIIILAALALTALDILTSCQKGLSSSTPTTFTVSEISQSLYDKQNHVTRYKMNVITTDENGIRYIWSKQWFTLIEGFQVGDTLEFVKIKK